MLLKELMKEAGFSQYRLAVESGVPHATLSGLLTGKTKIERCESGTLYKLAKTLGVSMEILVEDGIRRTEKNRMSMVCQDICSMIWICIRKG